MPSINRNAIFIAGRPPLFEWANSLHPTFQIDPLTDPLEHDNGAIYRTALGWAKRNYLYLFEMELWGWCEEAEKWPEDRSWDRFREWFYLSFISTVENTLDEPIVEVWG